MNRRVTSASTRSFLSAVSAAWADCRNASRLLVEHQMGPQRSHHS